MAPQVKHDGFLVPNAGGEGVLPRMAEVDQVDFNTLSQTHKWSVIEGCKVSVTVTSASTPGGGIAIVNGELVSVNAASTADLGRGLEQDRFDLIAVGTDGNIKRIDGVPSFDPVFPDPPFDVTVLAAVFCPAGASSFSELVIDKRVFAPSALMSKLAEDRQLVRNVKVDETGLINLFTIRGDGYTIWNRDTSLHRESPQTLRITNNLNLSGQIQAGDDITAKNLIARNLLKGKNLFTGNASVLVGDEPKGAIRQDPNGRLYVNAATGWVEIATIENTTPVGTIIQSVKIPGEMPPGWVQLNGDVISIDSFPNLFPPNGPSKLIPFLQPGGTTMKLPNLTDVGLIGTQTDLGETGSKNRTLKTENLPAHKHDVKAKESGIGPLTGRVGAGGGHTHKQLQERDGAHNHSIYDPGHRHDGMEFPGQNSMIIAEVWGGKNKIDAEFADRNHTSSVEPLEWIASAKTKIEIYAEGSEHNHILEGAPPHDHSLVMDSVTAHNHDVTESPVGSGVAFELRPPSFYVFMYIKA